jgi:ABC-type sulfate transport system substrate-binding protein
MMTDMVLRGPSQYDCLLVYESVVIDRLKAAEGRWGGLHVVYPKYNLWNENPYYILDVPWSDAAHRQAAEAFLEFLMSEPAQRAALTHGFRPGNPDVHIKDLPDSPFTLYDKSGLKIDLNTVCEPPKAAVVNTLIEIWEKRASR